MGSHLSNTSLNHNWQRARDNNFVHGSSTFMKPIRLDYLQLLMSHAMQAATADKRSEALAALRVLEDLGLLRIEWIRGNIPDIAEEP